MGEDFKNLQDWLDWQLSFGEVLFSKEQLAKAFPLHTDKALKSALQRLSRKGKVVSIHQGYYLIIAPQYSHRGIIPPHLFIDDLMQRLNREYYVALLSAAARYGASHQSAQTYFIITTPPPLRDTLRGNLNIRYLCKKSFPLTHLVQHQTERSYLWVSRPELTALDLLRYRKQAGGINRIAVVLGELVEAFDAKYINHSLLSTAPLSVVQRLGYLLEEVVEAPIFAERLYKACQDLNFRTVPLDASASTVTEKAQNRWRVGVNVTIDPDL